VRSRLLVLPTVLLASVVLLDAVPALAATSQTPAALSAAKALGASVTVLGTPLLTLADTNAHGQTLSGGRAVRAVATGVGSVLASQATAFRTTDGKTMAPANGQLCATPDLAALGLPAAVAGAVRVGAGCANATADLAGAVSSAVSRASGLGLGVSGAALAKVITDLIVPTATTVLNSATGPVTTVTASLTGAVTTVCTAVPAPANTICTAALAQLEAVSKPTAQELITALTTAITKALAGVELLTIDIGGTASSATSTAGVIGATASSAGLSITSPSLKVVLDAIRAAVTTVLTSYVNAVVTALRTSPVALALANTLGMPGLIDTAAAAVKTSLAGPAQAAVTTVVDALVAALPFLNSPEPLLKVRALDDHVAVSVPRSGGTVKVDSAASSVTVQLSAALASFLKVPATTTISAGQDLPLFAGTPLASRVRVGSTAPVTQQESGVSLRGARADGVTLDLLTGVQGGVSIMLAPVTAVVGAQGAVTIAPLPTKTTLPRTGGSSPWLALALLTAAGWVLRFRTRRV
jgi:hypothetical protein